MKLLIEAYLAVGILIGFMALKVENDLPPRYRSDDIPLLIAIGYVLGYSATTGHHQDDFL